MVGAPSPSAELPGTETAAVGRGGPSGPCLRNSAVPPSGDSGEGRGEERAGATVAARMAGEEAGAHAPLAPPRLCCARLGCCVLAALC